MSGIHRTVTPMNTLSRPIVWTIAGSDSGGGAGIQADLATMQDLECHPCSVITTVTAQSSVAVNLVEPVSESMLLAQLATLLSDLPPMAIKIGLLANQTQVCLLADWLAGVKVQYPQVSVVLDPVMVASCGALLTPETARKPLAATLDFTPFGGVLDIITPNLAELSRLVGRILSTPADVMRAAEQLSGILDCSVLAKGGDIDLCVAKQRSLLGALALDATQNAPSSEANYTVTWNADLAQDYLVCRNIHASGDLHQNGRFWLSSPRIHTVHNHGSGCTLSSAMACVLAHGFVLQDAVVVAKAYVSQGLEGAYGVGQGPGPLARRGWPNDISRYAHIQWHDSHHQSANHVVQAASMSAQATCTFAQDSERQSPLLQSQPPALPQTDTKSAISLTQGDKTPAQYSVAIPHNADKPASSFLTLASHLGVYPVVSSLVLLEQLLAAGANTIQLRVKLASSQDAETEYKKLEMQIRTAIALGKHYQAQVFINDHWQLAIKHGAFGVHLGQEDLAQTDLSAIKQAGLALGISSHSYFELLLAHQVSPSYIALGHIFPTTTKQMPSAPQGLRKLSRYVALLKGHYPLVAIGGIDSSNLAAIKATGVDNIAVVRAVTDGADPAAAWQALQQAWEICE